MKNSLWVQSGKVFFFFKIFLEDISPFCGATDIPVLDLWWHLHWVSKPGWVHSLACFLACAQWIPQIHFWCDTCWLYRGQHGSQAFLIHIPADCVRRDWWRFGARTHDRPCRFFPTSSVIIFRKDFLNVQRWKVDLFVVCFLMFCRLFTPNINFLSSQVVSSAVLAAHAVVRMISFLPCSGLPLLSVAD